MRILYLCADLGIPVLGRKGASVHVRSLVGALTRAGHSVVVAAPVLNKSPWELPLRIDGTLWHMPPGVDTEAAVLNLKSFNEELGGVANSLPGELRRILYNRELTKLLKRRLEGQPPDFIYERASLYATAGVHLARELNVPLIVELNAPLVMEQSAYRATGFQDLARHAERFTLSHADTLLVVSEMLREYAIENGVPANRVHVVPNGVDPELFFPAEPDPEVRARWRLGAGPILGFVGGLRPWHGVECLPELLARLVPHHENIRLMIVGDGPLRSDLERELAERQLSDRAVFTGALPHEDVAALIRQFDVALAPYPRLDHAFYFSPLKLFEYMACGVAVVAPQVGQISEIVCDRETGLLYPAGDLDSLAAACETLLTDATLRRRLGQSAAKEIRERYTWNHNAGRVTELARTLIASRGGGT